MAIEVDVNDNGTIDIQYGGTNASTAAEARTNLGIGTAGQLNAGNAVGEVVVVQSGNKLPALDGSDLINLPASAISGVSSVNGESGAVVLDADDISDGVNYAIITKTEQANIANNTLQVSRIEHLDQKVIDAEAAAASAITSAISASTSETNAAASESMASTSASNASISEANANADAAQTALDRIATSADAASTAADLVQTNLDTIATAADVVSSSNSASAAASSAAAASTSESNAATSEANAAQSAIDAAANQPLDGVVVSESNFKALAAYNRDKFAGSGFVEWGKHHNEFSPINEGMAVFDSETWAANKVILGIEDSSAEGTSKTTYPITNINGSIIHIFGVNAASITNRSNDVLLPPAPIATNLVTNGTFDTDTSGWAGTAATLSATSGVLRVTNTVLDSWGNAHHYVTSEVGKTYRISVEYKGSSDNSAQLYVGNTSRHSFGSSSEVFSFDYTATSTSFDITLTNADGVVGSWAEWDNISVIDLGKVERQDLVFLESWHEKISDKDIVYPYGNTQSLLAIDESTGLTTANGSFSGYDTYSLFGNWQTAGDLIGKGLVWSTMTDANKKKFVSDPENNIYLAEDGELIQVRYRIRVIEGLGADWENISTSIDNAKLAYTIGWSSPANWVTPKGSGVSISDDFNSWSVGGFRNNNSTIGLDNGDKGFFTAIDIINNLIESIAYKGLCFALPIALVSRRNQGAYHPVFNPNGTTVIWNNTELAGKQWYESNAKKPLSTFDCFDFTNLIAVVGNGKIGSVSGRPDNKYFDAIYEGDVLDLRNSAHKPLDLNRTLEREFNKLVAGEMRGWEGAVEFRNIAGAKPAFYKRDSTDLVYVCGGNDPANSAWVDTYGYSVGERVTFYFSDGEWVSGTYSGFYVGGGMMITNYVSSGTLSTSWVSNLAYCIGIRHNLIHSKELLQCDIIGDPASYPQEWIDNGIAGTPLLVGEDGEDYTNFTTYPTVANFKLSRKATSAVLLLRSSDSGVTWVSDTITLDQITNKLTNGWVTSDHLTMVFYLTEASPFEEYVAANKIKLLNEILTSNDVDSSLLISGMVNKVPVGSESIFTKIDHINGDEIIADVPSLTKGESFITQLERLNGKLLLDVNSGINQKTVELPYFIGDGE